jgi:hypothetical protein
LQVTLQALSFRHIALGPVLVTDENNDASLTYGFISHNVLQGS